MTAKIQLPPKLIPVFHGESRYRGAYGGRGSAKTRSFALMSAVKAYIFAEAGREGIILCCRQFQNSLSDSSMMEVKLAIQSVDWLSDYFDIGEKYIRTKNKRVSYVFSGLDRNIDSIKSKARVLLSWIDEAENVSEEAYKKLIPTVREDDSEVWVTWNPETRGSATDKRFRSNSPLNSNIIELNWRDNPKFPKVLGLERQADKERLSDAEYRWIWEGAYLEDDDRVIIPRIWINAAIDAHTKLGFEAKGIKRVGFDVADDGKDLNANANRHGSVLVSAFDWKAGEDEILLSCQKTYDNALNFGGDIVYDAVGVGASAGGEFKRINGKNKRVNYYKFIAQSGVKDPDKIPKHLSKLSVKTEENERLPTNKELYVSLKDQAWAFLSIRFRNTYNAITKGHIFKEDELISISSSCGDIEKITNELSAPLKCKDGNERFKVESKVDMRKRGLESPNLGDAIVMAFMEPKDNAKDRFKALS